MKKFRTILFWLHLGAGLVAGCFIGIMCITGALLAFESEIVSWAERDARIVPLPRAGVQPLPVEEMQRRARAAHPELGNPAITITRDAGAAVGFGNGREVTVFMDPYTGVARAPASTKVRAGFRTLLEWHRYLGREGNQRPTGKAITGACNAVFAFLAISGLYLWLPRTWSRQGVKAVAMLNLKLSGRPRDFNWHNTVGLWCAPLLVILSVTALPISYRWASNAIYRLAGESPPVQGVTTPAQPPAPPGRKPLPMELPPGTDAILAQIRQNFPSWEQIIIRPGDQPGAPLSVTIRERGSWPRMATTTLTLAPHTGEALKREGFMEYSPGRRLRFWSRYLHTGQALGWPGQLMAGLVSLGGCVLVYTGLALSWRRFVHRKIAVAPGSVPPAAK